jgi:hypothetical protein
LHQAINRSSELVSCVCQKSNFFLLFLFPPPLWMYQWETFLRTYSYYMLYIYLYLFFYCIMKNLIFFFRALTTMDSDEVCMKSNQNTSLQISFIEFNPLVPSDPYMGHTTQLTSRCCILNTYSTNIRTEYFKRAA